LFSIFAVFHPFLPSTYDGKGGREEGETHSFCEGKIAFIKADKYFGDCDDLMDDKDTKCESASSSAGEYIKR
jgi:hypothetical protein